MGPQYYPLPHPLLNDDTLPLLSFQNVIVHSPGMSLGSFPDEGVERRVCVLAQWKGRGERGREGKGRKGRLLFFHRVSKCWKCLLWGSGVTQRTQKSLGSQSSEEHLKPDPSTMIPLKRPPPSYERKHGR